MNTTLLVYLDNRWNRLDIYEDIPISVVIQQLDLNVLDQRKSNYSKQFVIPNTNNNAQILENYFEVNGIDFNPLQKVECVVQYRGQDIFSGYLRLSAVINNPGYTDYEIYILGQVGDFATEIRDLSLQDINWSDLQHELSYSAITQSWNAKNNNTDGLFGGKVLYPMINYGLPYDNNNEPVFTYSFSGDNRFTLATNPIPEDVWKPALRLREIVDRIFELTQYTIQSEFFDTDYFKSIYMDTFTNGQLGVQVSSAVTNQNIFKAYTWEQQVFSRNAGQQTDFPIRNLGSDGYDPLGNLVFSTVGILLPNDNPNGAYFRVPFPGTYGFNIRFNYDDNNEPGGTLKFQVIVRKSQTLAGLNGGTIVAASETYELLTSGLDGSVDFYPSFTCDAGDYVKVFIKVTENQSSIFVSGGKVLRILPYNNYGITTEAPMFELYSGPALEGTKLVDFKIGLQDINCIEFLKGLIKMFNLVVIQDEPNKTITIEPFTWYFREDNRVKKDWTNRLDLSSSYRTEPLSFELPKEVVFTYRSGDEEYLSKIFQDRNDYIFGRKKFITTNNIFTGIQTYELPFAPLPTDVIGNSQNFIIPQVYRDIDGQQLPYSSKPHLFFWNGNRYAYQDQFKGVQGSWYIQSGTTPVQWTTYPCVSHLSSLDVQLPDSISDLSFTPSFDFFGNVNEEIVQFSPNNLYNLFWEDYIEDTYSNETRRLIGRFFMRPLDVYETSLTDRIFVKDSFYRIEKINEADLVSEKLTEVSLIKERGGYYKVIPPPPFYGVDPNEAYPTFGAPVQINAYTGESSSLVCLSTGATGSTYVFVSGATSYSTLDYVYYEVPVGLGSIYAPLPMGTYIRQIGTTDTYVVSNKGGQIIPFDGCI